MADDTVTLTLTQAEAKLVRIALDREYAEAARLMMERPLHPIGLAAGKLVREVGDLRDRLFYAPRPTGVSEGENL